MAKKSDVDKTIDVVEGTMTKEQADKPEYDPIYRVYENTRVPVSKSMGKLWSSRFKEAKALRKQQGLEDRWNEVIGYYQNDHGAMNNKKSRLSEVGKDKGYEKKFLTENIVFANASALVPATYAKNPDVEITSEISENEPRASLFERLIDTLMSRKSSPGINIKPKCKKAVLTTTLTNISYLELSYVRKEDSSEEAIQEIESLSKQLSEATSIDEIQEIEGKLQALEERVSFLTSSGPKIRFRNPNLVIVDPDAENGDPEDADWVMIGDYVRTGYLRAMYGKKDDKGNYMSIYKPTHVLSGDEDMLGHDDDINNFTLITGDGEEHQRYGYKTEEEFRRSCRTLCWYVWDKTTRRVLMFNDDDWSWPIWVWDDPYKLSRFFNIFALSYTTDPKDMFGKSEVMYYLDHQDELNDINNERARMRHWAVSKVFLDTNSIKDKTAVAKFLTSDTDELVFGFDLPDGKKITDIIGAFPSPSTQFEQLFDNKAILEGVNRLSSVTPTLQNVQYKTNTTNKAIESYESSTAMRLDEKIDAIEDLLADIGRALLEMCIQFMEASQVEELLGKAYVDSKGGWNEGMTVAQFNQEFNLKIVGGSTLKPTSKVKKEQAAQLGQVLGQFANASPMIVIVMLKMLERAFGDDVIITPEEWEMIIQSTMQQMQRGGPGQGEGQPQGQQQGGQQPPAEGQDQQQGADQMNAVMDQVSAVLDRLPPAAKKAIASGIAEGIPLKQVIQQVTQAASASKQQRPN